jgi:cobaltochelatase CobS
MKDSIFDLFGVTSPNADTKKIPTSALVPMGSHTGVAADPNFVFEYRPLKRVLRNLGERQPLWAWGPSGCRKTELFVQVGARLQRPVEIISFGEETSLRELSGTFHLVPDGLVTRTEYRPGTLAEAITTPLAIVVLDEFNMASPGVSAQLNRLIEAGELVVPETGEVITAAADVTFVATANTSGAHDETGIYAGSQLQNGATRNRFAGLKMGYLAADLEMEIVCRAYPGVDQVLQMPSGVGTFSKLAVEMANGIRAVVEAGSIGLPFSVRTLKRFVGSSLAYGDYREGFADAFFDLLTPQEATAADQVFHKIFGVHVEGEGA